jgi:NADH-quinone oxidoreductase subunit N
MPDLNLAPAIPELFLTGAICLVLLIDVFLRDDQRHVTYTLAMFSLVGTAGATAYFGVTEPTLAFGGAFVADPAGGVLKLLAYVTMGIVFLYARPYLEANGLFKGEFFVLGLFGLLGIMIMISAQTLLIMYLGLEVLALSQYTLVAFNRDSAVSAESAMKYFVLGAIASGALLYGISILYGITGTLDITELALRFSGPEGLSVPVLLAIAFIIVGVAFKFGAVSFHMWLPDVYQGAPAPVTLFIGSAPKIAAFALMWRVMAEALGPLHGSWQDMLIVLSVLSLAIGNVVAIAQTNLKRMLAYSTISHVGYILLGFIAGGADGIGAAMFYTIAYVLMAAAAFGMIILLSRRGFEAEQIDDFKGLNARSGWFAIVMLIIMISMAGVPGTVGFFAKVEVISAVQAVGLNWLAGVAVLFAVIGAYYYLRVIRNMFFEEAAESAPLEAPVDLKVAISANALVLVVLGIFPGQLLDLCARVLSFN